MNIKANLSHNSWFHPNLVSPSAREYQTKKHVVSQTSFFSCFHRFSVIAFISLVLFGVVFAFSKISHRSVDCLNSDGNCKHRHYGAVLSKISVLSSSLVDM